MAYIFAADSMGQSSFNFFVVSSERRVFSGTEYVSARSAISHRFWDTATYWLEIANFSYPTLI